MKYLTLITALFLSMTSVLAQDVSPVDLIEAQLSAYNDRDIDAFVATYADDVTCYEYGQQYPFVEGKAALKMSYGAMFQTSPNLYARSTNRIVQGNKVIDHEIAEGINGRSAVQVVVFYEIADGVIKKVTFIY